MHDVLGQEERVARRHRRGGCLNVSVLGQVVVAVDPDGLASLVAVVDVHEQGQSALEAPSDVERRPVDVRADVAAFTVPREEQHVVDVPALRQEGHDVGCGRQAGLEEAGQGGVLPSGSRVDAVAVVVVLLVFPQTCIDV